MVVAVDRDRDHVLAEKLFGDIGEAVIVGQAGDEGGMLLHQRAVVAALAVVPAAVKPGIQPRIELAAVVHHFLRRKELAKDEESEIAEQSQLFF